MKCRHCKRPGRHARWCPEVDIDDAYERAAKAGRYETSRVAFHDGYALGLLHAGLEPAAGIIERALTAMTPAELAALAQRISRPRPEIEVTARPTEQARSA